MGIEFENEFLISPNMSSSETQKIVRSANFIMLMGGDPFKQKEMCEKLGLIEILKKYQGVMLGFSAGAMLMSKYIIITPCSDEYEVLIKEEFIKKYTIDDETLKYLINMTPLMNNINDIPRINSITIALNIYVLKIKGEKSL
jgi:cyanophycinase-like exopeptidase